MDKGSWYVIGFLLLLAGVVVFIDTDRRTPQEKYEDCMIEGEVTNKVNNEIRYSQRELRAHCKEYADL